MAYYVLWIPNLEKDLVLRKTRIEQYNIADDGVSEIDAEIDPRTFQITFSYQHSGTGQKIVLSPFKKCQGCFLYYTIGLRTEMKSTLSRTLDEKFHVGLYHVIKCFYHQHSHHSPEEDSILHARFFRDEKAYQAETKSDAEYYIEEYIKKFSILNNDIDDCLEEIGEMESTEWKKIKYYLKIYSAYKRLIGKLCRYEGEYLYYQSLRQSVSHVLKDAANYDRKVSALDREIRIKWHRIESSFNHTTSIIGTNISTVGLLVSLTGIVLSIFATCSDKSETYFKSVRNELKEVHHEIRNAKESQDALVRSIDSCQGQIDSIAFGINRMDSVLMDIEHQQRKK